MGQIDLGNAATITGGQLRSFTWKLTKISLSVGDRESVAVSSLGDSIGPQTVLMGTTYDPGTVSIEGWCDAHLDDMPPIDLADTTSAPKRGEEYTITMPMPDDESGSNAGKIVFTGQFVNFSIDIPNGEAMTFTAEIRIMSALDVIGAN